MKNGNKKKIYNILCTIERPGVFPDNVIEVFFVKAHSENLPESSARIERILKKIEKRLECLFAGYSKLYLSCKYHHEEELLTLERKYGIKYHVVDSENLTLHSLLDSIPYLQKIKGSGLIQSEYTLKGVVGE